jgi:hypothetical protein
MRRILLVSLDCWSADVPLQHVQGVLETFGEVERRLSNMFRVHTDVDENRILRPLQGVLGDEAHFVITVEAAGTIFA